MYNNVSKMHFNTKDIVGQKFGKLLVKSIFNARGRKGQLKYECICDCGNSHTVTGESLRGGKSGSCGCTKKGRHLKIKDRREAIFRKLFADKIIKRGNSFKTSKYGKTPQDDRRILFEEYVKLALSPCYYCGLEWSLKARDNHGNSRKYCLSDTVVYHNGIDRINSEVQYSISNCVACCTRCNTAKNAMSQRQFYEWIKKIYTHLDSTNKFLSPDDDINLVNTDIYRI